MIKMADLSPETESLKHPLATEMTKVLSSEVDKIGNRSLEGNTKQTKW